MCICSQYIYKENMRIDKWEVGELAEDGRKKEKVHLNSRSTSRVTAAAR